MTKSYRSGKFLEKNNMYSNNTILSDSARNVKKKIPPAAAFSAATARLPQFL